MEAAAARGGAEPKPRYSAADWIPRRGRFWFARRYLDATRPWTEQLAGDVVLGVAAYSNRFLERKEVPTEARDATELRECMRQLREAHAYLRRKDAQERNRRR